MKTILCLLLLLPLSTPAVVLSPSEWSELEKQYHALTASKKMITTTGQNDGLAIMHLAHLIKALGEQKALTEKQGEWLEQLVQDDRVLWVQDVDHPEKNLPVLHISNMATAMLKVFTDKEVAAKLAAQWRNQGFNRDTFIELGTQAMHQAFVFFLQELAPAEIRGVSDQYLLTITEQTIEPNNDGFVALELVKATLEPGLASFLISLPANQHTTAFVQKIPSWFHEGEAKQLLFSAANESQSRSQSYLLLAKHFPGHQDVAAFIAAAMLEKANYWDALMVVPVFVEKDNYVAFQSVSRELPEALQVQLNTRLPAEAM